MPRQVAYARRILRAKRPAARASSQAAKYAAGHDLPLILSLGWWATQSYTQLHKNHDPSEVIIDEVAGQWIALLPLAVGATHAGASLFALWPGWVAAFLLFRLFDIWKPSIIGWADRRSDAIGVMLDDCFAGLFAALGVIALAGLFHGLLS